MLTYLSLIGDMYVKAAAFSPVLVAAIGAVRIYFYKEKLPALILACVFLLLAVMGVFLFLICIGTTSFSPSSSPFEPLAFSSSLSPPN